MIKSKFFAFEKFHEIVALCLKTNKSIILQNFQLWQNTNIDPFGQMYNKLVELGGFSGTQNDIR